VVEVYQPRDSTRCVDLPRATSISELETNKQNLSIEVRRIAGALEFASSSLVDEVRERHRERLDVRPLP
jgi:hypothetical protein